ncbi:MAG: lytic murein transglycosylase B [Gammaproteobacteria bacterium]|nr:lytic murein transglycosylase B [Gammaproteobacteria bacterium]MCP5199226.1 lytic murein transglycosylase B [Gammaproteobacteria bacterium]
MRILLGLLLTVSLLAPATRARAAAPDGLGGFIDHMHADYGFDAGELERLFAGVQRSDRIIELMSRPAEKVKPWWEYRALFISDQRIAGGAAFWRTHANALQRAAAEYGVAPEVIVAIIGVETSYGRIIGNYRVIDALYTLSFHYPGGNEARQRFFRAQLEHFLLFAREEGGDPYAYKGSYAGAMGMPQFMPENYRKLAVDFDADGQRNIWDDADDAIGSIANYLAHHGWARGKPVMSPARVDAAVAASYVQDALKPEYTLGELVAAGVVPQRELHLAADAAAALYGLEARDGEEYWLGFDNFYVISRYNPRLKYAMAVAQLAEAIRDRYTGAE